MYTALIGKKLISIVNEKEKSCLTAKEFFEQKYHPLFFDHPKYLQWVINSPFVHSYKSAKPPDKAEREEMLKRFYEKVSSQLPDASIAIGFPAENVTATTSGQVTTLEIPFSEEDIYASWIGAGLGIGIAGGLTFLIDNEELLYAAYQGWERYRRLVNETPNARGNQIETWNGHWITHYLNSRNPFREHFMPFSTKDGVAEISTQSWIRVMFALSRKFPEEKLLAYIYSLGQTNKTIGFIQFNLPEVKREIDIYLSLFNTSKDIGYKVIDEVYNTSYAFMHAAQAGVIGLREIEPKGLYEYMPGKGKKVQFPKLSDNEDSIINYNIYISWVIAMINDKKLLTVADEAAAVLIEYEGKASRGRTGKSQNVNKLFESFSRKTFIENLIAIMQDDGSSLGFFNDLVSAIDAMPVDKFSYFITLMKFKYTYHKNLKPQED
jgi:hypothetical protein